MFKYLIILGVIMYVFYKIASFFFRAGAAAQKLRNFENNQQQQTEQAKRAQKEKRNIKATGEYIDYEEVK